MVIRTETHLNVPLKTKMKGLTWEQAVKYAMLHDLNYKGTHIVKAKQDGDRLILIKRIPTEKNWYYKLGFRQRGWYERVIIDRKDQSVAIDSFDNHHISGINSYKRDLFFPREDEPGKLIFVRHHHWINQIARFYHQFMFGYTSWRMKSKVSKY